MSASIQNYASCLLLRYCLPLMPLIVGFIDEGDIPLRTYTLTVSIYALMQAVSSRYPAVLAIGIFSGVVLAATYGAVDSQASAFPLYSAPPTYILISTLALHMSERYLRHVNQREPFFLLSDQE